MSGSRSSWLDRAGLPLCLSLVLLVACAGQSAQRASGSPMQASNTSTSDFTARDIEGRTVRLSDHLGKEAILLTFCATFCAPCLAEFPHLNRLYEEHKAKGFVILAIAMDGPETAAEVPAFARRNGVKFPMLLDEDSQIASLYNPRKSMPLSILIDKQGRVVRVRDGYNPGDEKLLAADVEAVLPQSPGVSSPSTRQ